MPVTGLVTISPQPSQPALNFVGATAVENKSEGAIDITIAALGVPGIRARATLTTNQAITSGVNTPLNFDTNVYDTASIHSTTVNTSRFTVPTGQGGVWMVWGQVKWANVATSQQRGFAVTVNGNVNAQDTQIFFLGATFTTIFPISDVLVLNDGDFVEFVAFQNTGSNMNATSGSFGAMIRLGGL